MATNAGKGSRTGSVRDRTQVVGKGTATKRDTTTGGFIDRKADDKLFKGVAKQPDKRRR